MAIWLKQSTATTIRMGPFVAASDGFTALATTITIAATFVRRAKAGANWVGNGATAGAVTSISMVDPGWAQVSFAASDADTVGPLHFYINNATGNLPVWAECFVLPANVYDSLVGTDNLQVDVIQVTGAAPSAASMGADLRFILGAAVNTGSAQLGVNVVTVTGGAVSAATINANMIAINNATPTAIMFNANVLLVTGGAVSDADINANVVLINNAAPSAMAFLVVSTVNANILTITGGAVSAASINANVIAINNASPTLTTFNANTVLINGAAPTTITFNANVLTITGGAVSAATINSNMIAINNAAPTTITFNANLLTVTGAAPSTGIPNYLLDKVIYTHGVQSITLKDTIKYVMGGAAGQLSGATTATVLLKSPSGATLFTAAVVSGNRTGVSYVTGVG